MARRCRSTPTSSASPTSRRRRSRSRGRSTGSRTLRNMFRKRIAEFTSAGISPRKLGLMLGFHTTPGSGGRERARRPAWLEVTKLQALAAQAGREGARPALGLVVGLGGLERGGDRSRQAGSRVRLPLGALGQALQRAGGRGLELQRLAHRGPARLPGGRPLHAPRQAGRFERDLRPDAGDRRRGRRVHGGLRPRWSRASTRRSRRKQVSTAEKAVVTGASGATARYRAALAQGAREPAGGARSDRRRAPPSADRGRMHVPNPSVRRRAGLLRDYAQSDARLVETKTPAPWLGNRRRGFALASNCAAAALLDSRRASG